MHKRATFAFAWAILAAGAFACPGCVGFGPKGVRPQYGYLHEGRVYFLDGAGGGSILTNWGGGVRDGLRDAGYQGDFVPFRWQTGLGLMVDQAAGLEYKRSKAEELARLIQAYREKHPRQGVNLIGLSAGTAILVFALESLPQRYAVDTVVLLGSSLSTDYDLTAALRSVKGRLYVFTSEVDPVLRFGVRVAGTAERDFNKAAGLSGFELPPGAGADTRRQYAKLVHRRWTPEYVLTGNLGGHVGSTQRFFIRKHVASLMTRRALPDRPASAAPQQADPEAESRSATTQPGASDAQRG